MSDKTQTRVSIQHLESLYEINPDKVSLDSLQKEYGYFWEVYRQYILSFSSDSSFADDLKVFSRIAVIKKCTLM